MPNNPLLEKRHQGNSCYHHLLSSLNIKETTKIFTFAEKELNQNSHLYIFVDDKNILRIYKHIKTS